MKGQRVELQQMSTFSRLINLSTEEESDEYKDI